MRLTQDAIRTGWSSAAALRASSILTSDPVSARRIGLVRALTDMR
jgi:hypothetical protein